MLSRAQQVTEGWPPYLTSLRPKDHDQNYTWVRDPPACVRRRDFGMAFATGKPSSPPPRPKMQYPRGTRQHIPNANIAQILQDERQLADRAGRISALILDLEIADKNKARAEDLYFKEGKQPNSAMMKPRTQVSGSGYNLAKRLFPDTNPNQPPKPEVALGAFPPQFRPVLCEYRPADVFDLIEFYNESFGIVRGDSHEDMIQKIFGVFTTSCSIDRNYGSL